MTDDTQATIAALRAGAAALEAESKQYRRLSIGDSLGPLGRERYAGYETETLAKAAILTREADRMERDIASYRAIEANRERDEA